MPDKSIFINRRDKLRTKCTGGLLILPGNNESPMNYSANQYKFRQDSNFLYFFGIDLPGLVAVIDLDRNGYDTVYGEDLTIDDIIWMGSQPALSDIALAAGALNRNITTLSGEIDKFLNKGKKICVLPPYRADQKLLLSELLHCSHAEIKNFISPEVIHAVVSLREVKETLEIIELEIAIDIAHDMHTTVMKMAFAGTKEREIAGIIEGIALGQGGMVSFPVILSMDGQTLHNHYHGNTLAAGRMVLTDAGCESPMHYASDITRTIPVGGKFSQKQRDIYQVVLNANMRAIKNAKPGIYNRDLHMLAATTIAEGLKDLGLMKGNIGAAVAEGAHALFFPHGIGHMLGLDVHDMESLGENYVGYDETITRSSQFGTAFLRLAKKLKTGFVLTIEPGIYFIPELIDLWKKEKKFEEYINYEKVESFRDFGGIRIEDDILITETGCRVLGKPIPKMVSDIESFMER